MLLLIQNNYDCDSLGSWFWWLIGAFLLGALLGWLLRCILGNCSEKSETVVEPAKYDDKNEWKMKYEEIEQKLSICNNEIFKLKTELDACNQSKIATSTASTAVDSAMGITASATPAFVAPKDRDNLKKIEGIGPKIEQLLFDDGIYTWAALATTEVSRIQNVLDKAGPRYRVHNPGSWPLQAKMAAEGKWEALNKWQDEHKGGLL